MQPPLILFAVFIAILGSLYLFARSFDMYYRGEFFLSNVFSALSVIVGIFLFVLIYTLKGI